MLNALYPGSFDPPTNGHINIARRASKIFDEVHIVIADNIDKSYLFNADERFELMKSIVQSMKNVQVHVWDKLIVDFAGKVGAKVLLRGVRALADFSHEFELSMLNRGLDPELETLLMPTDPKYFVLRSSAIKELVVLNGDVSTMVPPQVEKALKDKLLPGEKEGR